MQIIDFMDRPIAFHRAFVPFAGVTGALFLSQALYWTKRTSDPDGWFYKTASDWEQETGLTRREQETVRKRLISLGILKEQKRGIPCKLYYRICLESLETRMVVRLAESAKLECTKAPNCDGGFRQTNSEITTETKAFKNNTRQRRSQASRPDDVSESVWNDYLSLRKQKRSPLTETALRGIINEAEKAGITLEQALELCCARGWQGFKSEWTHENNSGINASGNVKSEKQRVREALLGIGNDVSF